MPLSCGCLRSAAHSLLQSRHRVLRRRLNTVELALSLPLVRACCYCSSDGYNNLGHLRCHMFSYPIAIGLCSVLCWRRHLLCRSLPQPPGEVGGINPFSALVGMNERKWPLFGISVWSLLLLLVEFGNALLGRIELVRSQFCWFAQSVARSILVLSLASPSATSCWASRSFALPHLVRAVPVR
eukprot:9473352-Pyramimonas_sp.AAC.1